MDDNIIGEAAHFNFIPNDNHLHGKLVCEGCQKMFSTAKHLQQHQDGHCRNGEPKFIYPGGMYQRKETIFEQLWDWVIMVEKDRQLCTSFATWDCESLLVLMEEKIQRQQRDESIEQRLKDQNLEIEYREKARRLQFREKHVVATCALKSTVPGGEETQFFANADPAKVVEDVYRAMLRLSDLNYGQLRQKYVKEFERLEQLRQECIQEIDEDQAQGKDTRRIRAGLNKIERLIQKLDKFCRELCILTFNGGRYDMNLVKKYLIPQMIKDTRRAKMEDPKGYHPWPKGITRGSTIMALTTEKLKFLDVINYLSPGTSLAKFIKAFNADGDQKGIFPYELLRKYEDLETTTEFPSKSAFFSTLKNKGITDDEYEEARQVWDGLKVKNLMEFIKEYNSKDVEPMLVAVKNMLNLYWNDFNIDIFKEAISIPGVCMAYLFKRLEQVHPDVDFGLFPEAEASLCQEFYGKTALCGGLSFIGQRIAIKGETEIKRATYDDLEREREEMNMV